MSHLSVTLFGTVRAELDGRLLTFPTEKCAALLAYLAEEAGQAQRRDFLAGLLWPETTDQAARTNLRQTLHRLRTAIDDNDNPHPQLLVSARTIQLNPDGQHWLDVAEFRRCLERFEAHCANGTPLCAACQEALKTAAALYEGEFMAGFSNSASPSFELWLLTKQERYRRQLLAVLGRLGAFYEKTGDFVQAAACARRLVTLEPWRESSHRLLMRSLERAGHKREALTEYERCRQILAEDLGVEPSDETRKLYERMRDGRSSRDWRGEEGAAAGGRPELRDHAQKRAGTAAPAAAPAQFVGRERELARLQGALDQALAGQGRVLFIRGEAGSGKTSLAAEFCRRAMAAEESVLVSYGRCDGHFGLGDPYQPFREALRLLSGQAGRDLDWIEAEQMPAHRLQAARPAIMRALAQAGPDLPGTLLPDRSGTGNSNQGQRPDKRKQDGVALAALFEQVTGFLRGVARSRPLILFLDDLHWIDAASASLLFHLGRHLANGRLLIVAAYRPEEVDWFDYGARETKRHPLLPVIHGLQRVQGDCQIDLDRADGRAFVAAYVDSEPNRLDEGFRERLYFKTGGNPLFTVEMLRGLQNQEKLGKDEAGRWVMAGELDWEKLPARVEAVIAERLERLPASCQAILAVASVQGHSFLAEVVAGVDGTEAGAVIGFLSKVLARQHHLVEVGSRENYNGRTVSRYRFRHYLFQQFAYQQLDGVARSHIHEATGLALEALYADQRAEHAVELARHFEAAGIVDRAVGYWLAAGESAYRLSANKSALSYFDRALNLLEDSPPGPDRDRREMTLQLARTAPILAMGGYIAPEIREAANRVIALAEPLGEADYVFPARMLLLSHYAVLAEYRPALKLGQQLFRHAEREQNPLHLTQAHHFLGFLKFCAGSFQSALTHFDAALSSTDQPVESLLLSGFIGRNMGMTSLFRRAWALWFLGYPDQSLAALEGTMIKVEQVGQDHDLAFTLAIGICPLLYLQREYDRAGIQAKRLLRLADTKSLHYFVSFGQLILGAVQVKRGQTAEGQSNIKTAVGQYRESDEKTMVSFLLSLLADGLGADVEAGRVLDEALEWVEESGERFLEAELWRQRGEFLGRQGTDADEVEACFGQALAIARRQQAKILELRAATSLARFWQRQGRGQEAQALLAGVVGWFTEGFKTADWQEARMLLQELEIN